MKKLALINGIVYTGDSILHGQAVLIEKGRITGLASQNHVPKGREAVDLNGGIVAPGFIDVQVKLFTAGPTQESLKALAKAQERFGTLHWCPAVLSADTETMERCLGAVKAATDAGLGILGAHLEGPFLSPVMRGIHDERFIHPASDQEISRLLEAGGGAISLVTLAPEAAGERHISRFAEAGVRIFLGHTDAPCVIAEAAFAAGVCGVTHLYTEMSQLTGREPGVVGAALADKNIWAGIVADGVGTDWRSIQIAKEIKRSRLFLVTDAMPDGSAPDMAGAVRNCVTHCGIAPDEALRMASAYPANMLGIGNRLGYIRPGYEADLVFLDNGLNVTGIMRGGKIDDFQ